MYFSYPDLSIEARAYISDFDGSVIEVEDEKDIFNADYFMTLDAISGATGAQSFINEHRSVRTLDRCHLTPGNTSSCLGLMTSLNRSRKVRTLYLRLR